jgi:hypothetical protein
MWVFGEEEREWKPSSPPLIKLEQFLGSSREVSAFLLRHPRQVSD